MMYPTLSYEVGNRRAINHIPYTLDSSQLGWRHLYSVIVALSFETYGHKSSSNSCQKIVR